MVIILLGALQGLIFGGILFSTKNRANRYLAWLLFFISYASIQLYGASKGWFGIPLLVFMDALVPHFIMMPLGPLLFFYVKTSLYPDFRLTIKEKRQFYTVIIDLIPALVVWVFLLGNQFGWVGPDQGPWGRFLDAYNVYSDIPRWMSLSIYTWLALKEGKVYRINGVLGDQGRWLTQLLWAFLIFDGIWLIYLVPYTISATTDWVLAHFSWYPVYVPLAVLIYWLGINGYMQSLKTRRGKAAPAQLLGEDYLRTSSGRFIEAMERDKLYLNPGLSVADLAVHTGISPKHISVILNQHLHKSFTEFVNEYRVRYIQERLLQGDGDRLTIAGLAYEGGFNSVPTFQRAFKLIVGQTPTSFILSRVGKS
jgi:AraC-like DNA-binding protein